MTQEHQTRSRNPFRELMVTELIDNPKLYRKMFSEQILIGETLTVFRPVNTILTGPQGSGKSMILNLLRYRVLAEYIADDALPQEMDFLKPFLGLSINLQRAYFQAFGRRSAAKPRGSDPDVDASCAADYLNHFLFGEFLKALIFLFSAQGSQLARWMRLSRAKVHSSDLALNIAHWSCWYGYYDGVHTLDDLHLACQRRIDTWRRFLNTTMDTVPEHVWTTKTTLGEPLHYMGNLLQHIAQRGSTLPLYVVIDQYEVLPELNPTHGTNLQRVVNTLIKARDPVVFYRIGARTYDWGKELRVWGAESRIELQRDYVLIDLAEALMRNENTGHSTFRNLAADVAVKRLREESYPINKEQVAKLFGNETPEQESRAYFGAKNQDPHRALAYLPEEFHDDVINACGEHAAPLDLRLASAWLLQQIKRGQPPASIRREMRAQPWKHNWSWRKERILPGLCQLASFTRSKKNYAGWTTLVELSGANIAAFLLLASEIWDLASKFDHAPTDGVGTPITIPREIQSDGIRAASSKWAQRDRLETTGGSKRYRIVSRLGPAIHKAIISDVALSNPGHSGFSLREIDIERSPAIQAFLQNGVSWAILEERPHTSRNKGDSTRRKYYLHPLLSPIFEIPHRRAKEPLYITFEQAQQWFTTDDPIRFVGVTKHRRAVSGAKQQQLFI